MRKRVAVLIREPERQYEGLRCSLGLLLEGHEVSMFVLDHEISVSGEYMENMELIDEMGGARYSNHPLNTGRHGFEESPWAKLPGALAANDVIIPF